MHKIEFERSGRSMRWYEWLIGLLLLGMVAGVRAAPVYKCIDAEGGIAYQDIGCEVQQQQSTVAIAPAPHHPPLPVHAAERRREEAPARSGRVARAPAVREAAFECRAGDGRVFYRLGACPHSIGAEFSRASHRGKGGAAHGGSGGSVQVAARRIPLDLACREIHRAGAIGRDGHEFDEHVSTYEHNLGHDPCR